MSDDLVKMIVAEATNAGKELGVSTDRLRQVTAEQMAQLALAAGEPGYMRAVCAARDNILAETALEAVRNADATDNKIIGIIQGALFFGAQALAGAPGPEPEDL